MEIKVTNTKSDITVRINDDKNSLEFIAYESNDWFIKKGDTICKPEYAEDLFNTLHSIYLTCRNMGMLVYKDSIEYKLKTDKAIVQPLIHYFLNSFYCHEGNKVGSGVPVAEPESISNECNSVERSSNGLPKSLTEKENIFLLEHMNAILYSIMLEANKLSDKNIYDECNELFKLFSSYILYIQYGEVEKDSPLSKLLNYIKESE